MMPDIKNLKDKAKKFVREDDFENAVKVLQEIVSLYPEDLEGWYYLSSLSLTLENFEEAEKAIRSGLALDSENADYWVQLGLVQYELNPKADCIESYTKALKLEPNNVDALIGITEYYLDIDDLENAETYVNILENIELTEEEEEDATDTLVRYFLEKSMDGWTGSRIEDGETKYFPETIEQVEDTEHYIELAEVGKTEDKNSLERITLLKDVVKTNRQVLGENNSDYNEESPANNENAETVSLSKKDVLAWEKLESVYNLWTDIEEEDGDEYRWPKTMKEIKASVKILNKVRKIHIKDKVVKARLKELSKVLESSKKRIPNYSAKFFFSFVVSSVLVIGFVILSSMKSPEPPSFVYDQADWIVTENTELLYDAFNATAEKFNINSLPLSKGTEVEPLAIMGSRYAKVKTKAGNIGYVHLSLFKGSKNAIIRKSANFYSETKNWTIIDTLSEGEEITIIGYQILRNEKYGNFAIIRTSSGAEGIISRRFLRMLFRKDLPEISRGYLFPTSLENIEKKTKGTSLEKIEEKYGLATSILKRGNKKIAYFRQLNLIKGESKYTGVFFALDSENRITDYGLNKESRKQFLDKLPLAEKLRSLEAFNFQGFSYYNSQGKNLEIKWWEKFKAKNTLTKIIGWIAAFLFVVLALFLLFSIPRFIINPVILLISHFRGFANFFVIFLNYIVIGFASYVYLVWMALMMNSFFTPFVGALPTLLIWFWLHKKNIMYNRCPECHTMNVGVHKGTDFMGQTQRVAHGTYERYTGSSTTENVKTLYYERRRYTETKLVDHYSDKRQCIRCGHRWSVAREDVHAAVRRNH